MMKRHDTSLTGLALMALMASATAGCNEELEDAAGQTPTLNWNAPMNRVDGTKLYPGEIEGYRIYYRRSQASNSGFQSHFIESPSQTSWTPTPLEGGTYNFAVSTVDTTGLESPRSETLRVTIP